MNIVVCLKQTFDTEAKIVLNAAGKIDATGVNLVVNPYDEFAIEEALKLKAAFGGEVTVVSMGAEVVSEALRKGLAMGCDNALLVSDPALVNPDKWAITEILAKAVSQLNPDLILSGRIAVDDGASQVAIRLAEALKIPSVSSILKLDIVDKVATVTREIDGGTEIIEVPLPAVFTAQKGLNEPRLPTMMGIMKSKKIEIKVMTLADLGMKAEDLPKKMSNPTYSLPKPRTAGTRITGEAADSAKELAKLLREEAKVV